MFCEADAAAQGIFTGELRLTKGRYSPPESPRASVKADRSSTTDMSSPTFTLFLQRDLLSSVLSLPLCAFALSVLQEFP